MHRLLTHSSSPTAWLKECCFFYEHLLNRGYPAKAIDTCFLKIHWNPRKDVQDTLLLWIQQMCFLQQKCTRHKCAVMRGQEMKLLHWAWFFPTTSLVCCQEHNANGIYFTIVIYSISMGPLKGVPKIVGIPVPCCDPSVVEFYKKGTLDPSQIQVFGATNWKNNQNNWHWLMSTWANLSSSWILAPAHTAEVHLCNKIYMTTARHWTMWMSSIAHL